MGTNYYHVSSVCPHCGRGDEDLHIGKSSMGWAFCFRCTTPDHQVLLPALSPA